MQNYALIKALQSAGYRCIRYCDTARHYQKAGEAFTVIIFGCDDDCVPSAVVAWITQKTGLALMG